MVLKAQKYNDVKAFYISRYLWLYLLYFVTLVAVVLPYIFHATKNINIDRFDRYIGELSYPIYITHVIGLFIVQYFIGVDLIRNKPLVFFLALLLTLLLSWLGYRFVCKPIDDRRYKLLVRC